MSENRKDLILCEDFFPQVGGAHHWLYEVYKRWSEPVLLFANDFSNCLDLEKRQAEFDNQNHGAITLVRKNLKMGDISLFDYNCIKKMYYINGFIKKAMKNKQIILHCLRAFPEGISGMICKSLNRQSTKLVTYAHGEEILIAKSSRQLFLYTKYVYKHSDLVISNSKMTQKMVLEICPEANVVVVHPGVNFHEFQIDASKVNAQKKKWNIKQKTIILTTIARMEERKNHALVLRAISEIIQTKKIPFLYIIASQGPEEKKLKKLAWDLGIETHVKFTGYLSNQERILTYAISDIHVMPSIKIGPMIEGFGIVFLEAAAAGIPSIAGKIGGQAEAVLDNKTGIVIDGTSLEKLKNAICRLALDQQLRKTMGKEGKTWAKENDWDIIVHKIETHVKSL